MRVLIVEDDRLLGDAVQAGLKQAGFAADWVQDGIAAETALEYETYSALILDLGLPKRSGLEVLQLSLIHISIGANGLHQAALKLDLAIKASETSPDELSRLIDAVEVQLHPLITALRNAIETLK